MPPSLLALRQLPSLRPRARRSCLSQARGKSLPSLPSVALPQARPLLLRPRLLPRRLAPTRLANDGATSLPCRLVTSHQPSQVGRPARDALSWLQLALRSAPEMERSL